jgi:transaldolase
MRCSSSTQTLLAANAGVLGVPPYIGRLDDIRRIVKTNKHDDFKTFLLVVSVRHLRSVVEATLASGRTVPCHFQYPDTWSCIRSPSSV